MLSQFAPRSITIVTWLLLAGPVHAQNASEPQRDCSDLVGEAMWQCVLQQCPDAVKDGKFDRDSFWKCPKVPPAQQSTQDCPAEYTDGKLDIEAMRKCMMRRS